MLYTSDLFGWGINAMYDAMLARQPSPEWMGMPGFSLHSIVNAFFLFYILVCLLALFIKKIKDHK